MSEQVVILRLNAALARAVRDYVDNKSTGYASIDEFAEVALQNQLKLEGYVEAPRQPAEAETTGLVIEAGLPSLLLEPPETPPAEFGEPEAPTNDELFVLTNRLGPIKVAVRVLAQLQVEGAPAVAEFQELSSNAARELGLRLRAADEAAGRKGARRTATAFPVGKNERAALDRFISSFTLDDDRGTPKGPMVFLGLATVRDGKVLITHTGWELAEAPSPLIDGEGEGTLSQEEAELFQQQILRCPGEKRAVEKFLAIVERTGGLQGKVDAALRQANNAWADDFAGVHRAAMVGRLNELGLIKAKGRGPKAEIRVETWGGFEQPEGM